MPHAENNNVLFVQLDEIKTFSLSQVAKGCIKFLMKTNLWQIYLYMIQSQGNSQLRSQYNRYHWYIGYSKLGKLQETIKLEYSWYNIKNKGEWRYTYTQYTSKKLNRYWIKM